MREEVYIINGMTCASCSSAVERVTRKLTGVTRSDVNLATNKMTIEYDEDKVNSDMITAKVSKAGFEAQLYVRSKEDNTEENIHKKVKDTDEVELRNKRNNLIGAIVLSIILLYVSMGQMYSIKLPIPDIIDMMTHPFNFALIQILLTIPILYFGRRFFINGFNTIIHLNPNMDSLVAIGSGSSFVYSIIMTFQIADNPMQVHHLYFESSAIIVTFIMLGKYLESRSKNKTKGAITKLLNLAPDTAVLVDGDVLREVATKDVQVDNVILVRPGAKVPLDGIVIEGQSMTDEAMITGESLPVEKSIGSTVIGGSVNYNGILYVKVSRVGEDTTLSKIVRFVEEAQGKKAPISKIADKVAGYFVPAVIGIAIVVSIIWLMLGYDINFALRIFTSVLVIACPCALGLATPTAIMVGTGLGASKGILIRSGEALEITHDVNVVVLDKTGTITEGKPKITSIISDEYTKDNLLDIAVAVEKMSDHPLARAIVDGAGDNNNEYKIEEFENITGKGLKAKIKIKDAIIQVTIGNKTLISDNNILTTVYEDRVNELSANGQTPMYVAIDNKLKGIISVADTIKETSKEAIEKLQQLGIKVYMVTGDNEAAANYIGSQVNVDQVISGVLPEDKAGVIEELQNQGNIVMMVGDGINDAPALVQADVGAAIGNGSDIALESGDIVLMHSDLHDIYKAIRLSKLTIINIKQNLFWAFLYNTIGIPIAAGALYLVNGTLLNPMLAGLAMSLSSVCVVSNALRLRTKKL